MYIHQGITVLTLYLTPYYRTSKTCLNTNRSIKLEHAFIPNQKQLNKGRTPNPKPIKPIFDGFMLFFLY